MTFIHTDASNPDFVKLCCLLDDYLNQTAGGEENRKQYIQYNALNDIKDVVLAYDGAIPIGCASFKYYEPGVAEVKRVFIKAEYRGKGISKQLMHLIEKRAEEKGFAALILETSASLLEAVGLYRKMGYRTIDNYGQYKDLTESVCMQKKLS